MVKFPFTEQTDHPEFTVKSGFSDNLPSPHPDDSLCKSRFKIAQFFSRRFQEQIKLRAEPRYGTGILAINLL